MAVKIRLARRGRKKLALYDIVIADARSPRDGRFIEKLGTYNPNTVPATLNFDEDKALDWLLKGAQPTDTVRTILSYRGVLLRKHLQVGVIKGAITQDQADAKFEAWKTEKENKLLSESEKRDKKDADRKKAQLDAEIKAREARQKVIDERIAAEEAAKKAAEEEAEAAKKAEEEAKKAEEEAAAATEEPKAEEAKAEEPKAEEVKAEEPKAEEVKAEEPKAE